MDFTVTGSTSVSASFFSTFWASAPPAIEDEVLVVNNGRFLQDTTYPKFGVFRAFIDGVRANQTGPQTGINVFPGSNNDVLIASGLNPAISHNITLVYTTDPVYNTLPNVSCEGCFITVQNLTTDGNFGAPPPRRTRKFLFIGDSITSANAVVLPCINASKDDWSRSWGYLLGEAFEAETQATTVSSKGLLNNCCDAINVTIPDFVPRTFGQDARAETAWNFQNFAPLDAVFIHAGSNDCGHNSGPAWEALFSQRWAELAYNLSFVYLPAPPKMVFAALGPNTMEPAPWVLAGMAIAAKNGIPSTFLNFSTASMDGCGHPGVIGQPEMAAIAIPIVKKALGW